MSVYQRTASRWSDVNDEGVICMLHALKCKCVTAERSVFMSAHAPRMSVLAPRRFLTYGSNARGAGSRGWVFFFFSPDGDLGLGWARGEPCNLLMSIHYLH